MKILGIVVVALLALGTSRADAYPQFQLVRDSTCTSCHLSPAGGGLLNENGLNTAEAISQLGTKPEFMYGKLDAPSWLTLGGDFRAQGGYMQTPQKYLAAFPMQGNVYGNAAVNHLSAQVTLAFRPAQEDNEAATHVFVPEHYLMWQSSPGDRDGLFIRAGHFMPVFGLRFVEHQFYVRRFGGTPLFSETYAASVSYVTTTFEGHATGFIADPLPDAIQRSSGGAAYGEVRVGEHAQLGGGGMVTVSDWEHKFRGTVTGKYYLPMPGVLLQTELQVINPHVGDYGIVQLAGIVMASYAPKDWLMIDLAYGHYDENLRIHDIDRDCVDLNVHWFATSHLEAMLVVRSEMIGATQGGPGSGWAFAQIHYRL